jgi:hypothetical protein
VREREALADEGARLAGPATRGRVLQLQAASWPSLRHAASRQFSAVLALLAPCLHSLLSCIGMHVQRGTDAHLFRNPR